MTRSTRRSRALLAAVCATQALSGLAAGDSALNDKPVPLQIGEVPERVPPLLEVGDTFLGRGNIEAGFNLPTGAVWQPNLIVWGNIRSAVNYVDDEPVTGDDHLSEWVNRVDLFGQVSLSQTDRIVVGVRSFDENGEFFGRRFNPESDTVDADPEVSVAFLEVNLAELIPGTGNSKRRGLDMDVSIGRQPLFFQESLLIDDRMDAFAISRNNLSFLPGASNTRAAVVYAWNDINRGNNIEDSDATLWGLFTETDFPKSTVNVDFVAVESDDTGDGLYFGLSAIQRIGKYNTAFRIAHSEPLDDATAETTEGTVVMGEISWTPHYTHNNVYASFFWAEDEFNSAARDFGTGGPMGAVGILFAGAGLGGYPAPLGNNAIESYGGALGYQMFFANNRRQLILELGARTDTDNSERTQTAVGTRYQQAIGNHFVFRVDGYVSKLESFDTGFGGRVELQLKL